MRVRGSARCRVQQGHARTYDYAMPSLMHMSQCALVLTTMVSLQMVYGESSVSSSLGRFDGPYSIL